MEQQAHLVQQEQLVPLVQMVLKVQLENRVTQVLQAHKVSWVQQEQVVPLDQMVLKERQVQQEQLVQLVPWAQLDQTVR